MKDTSKWIDEFERIVHVIQEYDRDAIRLTKSEEKDMRDVLHEVLKKCPHPLLVEIHETIHWENNDFGHSWHSSPECKVLCSYCEFELGTKSNYSNYCTLNPKEYLGNDHTPSFKILLLEDKKRSDIKVERVEYTRHRYRWVPASPPPPPEPPKPKPKPEYLTKLETLEKLGEHKSACWCEACQNPGLGLENVQSK